MVHDVLLVSLLVSCVAASAPQSDETGASPELEAQFAQQLSGCKMVGHFTVAGSQRPAQPESYTIAKVEKVRDDRWRFDALIEYGGKSVKVPLVVPVRWAGDTPMIQVTDMAIPMLGTYSARVLIHRGQYAGTWSGGDHGGHMYGSIVRDADQAPAQDKAKGAKPAQRWASWRGPHGTGAAPDADPPVEWSEERNVRWKTEIPGLGISTPVIWDDRIYLTTAIPSADAEAAETPEPPAQEESGGRGRRGRGGRSAPLQPHEFVVFALDRKDGSVVWRKTVASATPHEAGHADSTQASNSPVTDGELVFAHFGSRGIYCLDRDGEVKWSKDFGRMQTRNEFGEGSSPALHGDTLIVNWDHEGGSFIVALDKRTGEELWRKPRDEGTTWSTPLVVTVDDREQVIVNATNASRGYDLKTGDVVWSCPGMTSNVIPSPAYADGIVYLMSGFRGASLQAIRLAGAKGDLEDGENVSWSHARSTSYVPSALLYDDLIYFLRVNNGVLSCLDAKTGEVHYEGQKIDAIRNIYSSPVGAGGRVYLTSRDGKTVVIERGPKYAELATNELDDAFDASAAIAGDELYLRGRKRLYCIAKP